MQNDKDTEIKTKYDNYSVDELKAALKNYFFYSGEFSVADMEEMNQIMAVLDRKEPISSLYTAEESLKQFKEAYSEELSSLGVRNTEEVIEEKPAAELEQVSSKSGIKPVRPVRRRKLLRTAVFAAAIIALIVAIAASASALGYNLFGWIPKWNKDVLGFGDEEAAPNELHDSSPIVVKLAQLGIDKPLYPHWLPEGFKMDVSIVQTDPFLLHEGYSNDDRFLTITIQPSTGTMLFEKDDTPYSEYVKNSIMHYIIVDDSQVTASWYTEDYIVYITGNISIEEIERIIDSVYEVKP